MLTAERRDASVGERSCYTLIRFVWSRFFDIRGWSTLDVNSHRAVFCREAVGVQSPHNPFHSPLPRTGGRLDYRSGIIFRHKHYNLVTLRDLFFKKILINTTVTIVLENLPYYKQLCRSHITIKCKQHGWFVGDLYSFILD